MAKAWPYNPHTPCLPLNEYYIEQYFTTAAITAV